MLLKSKISDQDVKDDERFKFLFEQFKKLDKNLDKEIIGSANSRFLKPREHVRIYCLELKLKKSSLHHKKTSYIL